MSSSVAKVWDAAAVGYFDPDGPSNDNQTNKVLDFISKVSWMAQIIDPQAIRENLQSCLRGRALTWWGRSAVQSYMASDSRVEHLTAMLLYYFDTDDIYRDWNYCIEDARSKLRLQQYRIENQRKRDNERREQERLKRQKRLKEQELQRQQYEMEQQRIYEKQELERQKAEQKAKDEAFACRRCPAKFPSNTKLHVHISAHHSKPSKAASAIMVPSPSTPPTPPISTPATPLSSPTLVISAASNTSLALITPPASTPAVTPKLSYAAIAGRHALPTPPPTPKTANPTCAKPKPVYMTIKDLFCKFAGKNPPLSLQTVTPPKLRPQSSKTLQKIASACPATTLAPYTRSAISLARAFKDTACNCFATNQNLSSSAVPTWEWTRQFGLRLRAWV